VARGGRNDSGGMKVVVPVFLQKLLEFLGFSTTQLLDGTKFDGNSGV
jgi:hypothetical protein